MADENTDPQDVKSLPQWAQDLIASVRSEAAQHRTARTTAETALSTAQEQLGKAVSQADFDKVKADLDTATTSLGETSRQLWTTQAVATHKLPAYLAGRLQGATADEIEADAKALAEQLGAQAPAAAGQTAVPNSPTGGLDPTAGQQAKSTSDLFIEAIS